MTYNYNYMYIYLSVLIKQTFNSTHIVQVNRDFILKHMDRFLKKPRLDTSFEEDINLL